MEAQKFRGYIGTYTKGDSEGIYFFELNIETEKIENIKPVARLGNPTYVNVSKDNQYLYAVGKDGGNGGVAAYRINKETGDLTELNKQLMEGASPCYIAVDSNNKTVVAANYHKGLVEAFLTKADGSLHPQASFVQHEGEGPNKERQEKPHVHYSDFTPDEKYIVVVDLGTDKIVTYEVNDGQLTEVQSLTVRSGSGPRHLTFHPNGKFAYVMTELSNEVIGLTYNAEDGSFREFQYISTIPADFTENNQGSAIHISRDGRFIYAGNRGHNSIAIYRVNEETGELTFVEYASSEGDWPRDFILDPTENYFIGSNQESSNIVLYRRNNETGTLTVLQSEITVPHPVCVKFLNY
ncbi:lactonase family protein [Caldibacillus lycopersici]|uniref:Lactonase family protein n=2 Tax=Perspicuibacillus lycopersici TaxID=1325689 RepID=A0AAE3LM45_9BACI|nr:lactonase family protein [Perspicuibacillus lycopersici]